MMNKRPIVLSFYSLIIINILDVISTKILLDTQQFSEFNPIMDFWIQKYDFVGAIAYKSFVLGLLAMMVFSYLKKKPQKRKIKILTISLIAINIFYWGLLSLFNFRYLLTI